MRLNVFGGVIFDLDGLVLDTEGSYFAAWRRAAEIMDYRLNDEFCLSLSGLQYQDVLRRIQGFCGEGFDFETFNTLSADCWREHVEAHGIEIKKGFADMLRLIQELDLPFCLATNSFERNARECLRHAGLERAFPLLIGRDAVAHGKPEPDIFYRAAELMHLPMAACLILEDSPSGALAASRTEAQLALIPSIMPADNDSIALADVVFEDLRQLADFIRRTVFDHV